MDMKPELYAKMVEKLGKERADKIVQKYEEWREENLKKLKIDADKQALLLARMLPKEQLIDGAYYTGYRYRGQHVALWDAREGMFITIHYQFGYCIERLPYFLDVIETNFDGFIPFAIIAKL